MNSRWLAIGLAFCRVTAQAWDYEGHRLVNSLALSTLPPDFPVAVARPETRERIAFLGGEPDRWRNTADPNLKHINNPDHYFDCEYVAELGWRTNELSPFRYVFTKQFINATAAKPGVVQFDPARDTDATKWLIGYLPWKIAEDYARLKSCFSYLRTFQELGTPEEKANAEANVIYVMGTMGHFIGDAAQPLHTTRNFNGWTDDNPQSFNTNKTIHAWIDGGYLNLHPLSEKALRAKLQPARQIWDDQDKAAKADLFHEALDFVYQQYARVQPLYQLEKEGKLARRGSPEGTAFLEKQLLTAARFLGEIWFTAWKEAQPDTYLAARLRERQANQP